MDARTPPVTAYFADSSVLTRSYLPDEADVAELRVLLRGGENAVMASQLADVEVASGLSAARRSGRLDDAQLIALLDEYEFDVGDARRVELLPLDPDAVLQHAKQIVLDHPIRTLDALHLAVADTLGRELAGDDELVFVTRDTRQRAVAQALGMGVV
jgi:uncharacterized protein